MQSTNSKHAHLARELHALLQKQQFKKIRTIYQSNKDSGIQDIDIWNIFANANSNLKKLNDVLYCCNSIINIAPDNQQALYNAALAYQYVDDPENAISLYEKCISLGKNHYGAYVNCAHIYHATGNLDKSIQYYKMALQLNNDIEVLAQLGEVLSDSGNSSDAISVYKQVLLSAPQHEKTLFLIAQLYYENKDYHNAEVFYLKLYQQNKTNIKVVNNLGRLYEEVGQMDKAILYYNEAIQINNKIPVIHLNLGKVLLKKGKASNNDSALIQQAMASYNKTIELDPNQPEAYFEMGKVHSLLGNNDKAKQYFTQALKNKLPGDFKKPKEFILAVKYYLSSINDPEIYDQDKKEFIADLFDGYADKFDSHLVNQLKYKTPELINKSLLELIDTNKKYNILDLGCGTGLCAPYLSSYSGQLTGIDLSEKMIQKAAIPGLYTNLVVGEISEIVSQSDMIYDITVAADVFVYIGGLADIFNACSAKMLPGSIFIFSTEKHDSNDTENYRLYDTGRYKHTISYLDSLIKSYGFELIKHNECVLREDGGTPIIGNLSILRKV